MRYKIGDIVNVVTESYTFNLNNNILGERIWKPINAHQCIVLGTGKEKGVNIYRLWIMTGESSLFGQNKFIPTYIKDYVTHEVFKKMYRRAAPNIVINSGVESIQQWDKWKQNNTYRYIIQNKIGERDNKKYQQVLEKLKREKELEKSKVPAT